MALLKVLYEDRWLIVCIKPAGVLSQSDDEKEGSMPFLIREHIGEGLPIGVVHRLDREVGGIMVFAKEKKAEAALSASLPENGVKKYFAVVKGKVEPSEGIMQDLLFKDSARNKSFVVKRERKGVRKASLNYYVQKTSETESGLLSLVEIKLHTGRTHQIRVQFSSRHYPLLGDKKYGGGEGEKIALWSGFLSFEHPITKERLVFQMLPPREYPWTEFEIEKFYSV